jgi:hypothetical protein
MYATALHSGEYHRLITCDECGAPLEGRVFREYGYSRYLDDDKKGKFCSSACKWEYSYRKACAVPGARPIAPMGAWGWACRKAREMNPSGCSVCKKPVTAWRWSPHSLATYRGPDGAIYVGRDFRLHCVELGPTEYHHKKPLYLGGNSLPENLEPLHPECHRIRHRRMPGKGNHQRKKRAEAEASQEVLDHFL